MGIDVTPYNKLRDNNMHSDGYYSFVFMDKKGSFAIISFDINKNVPIVQQIQGMKGASDMLNNWEWESGVFSVFEDWSRKQNFSKIGLIDPKSILYTQLKQNDEHYVSLDKLTKRFEKVVNNCNLHHNGYYYQKSLN